MMTNLYVYAATALIAGSVAATGAWQVQSWRYGNIIADERETFSIERKGWESKVAAAEKSIRDQQDQNRARSDAASAEHGAAIAKFNAQLKGSKNEIARLSDNLSSCRLMPDLVRLLNDQRAAIDASAAKN